MTATFDGLRRKGYLAAAAIATLAIGMASVLPGFASAAQVTGRSITMSDSTAGATGTVYALTMTMPTAVQSMVIDFCAESPIIGSSTCTAPTGMSAASAAYTAVNPGGNTPVGSGGPGSAPTGWSKGTFGASQLKLTASSATTAGTKYTFYFTNIKNPTSTGAFYARVYTYTGTTYGGYTSVSSLGTVQDSGGFALSTANNISVSATVQETLTFCISDVAPGSNCAGTNPPVVKLGTGNPVTIDSAAVYDNSAASTSYMQISTNAVSGAIVNMKSNYASCNGLSSDGGTTCGIPGSAGALAAGTAGFGLKVGAGTGGTGTIAGTNGYTAGAFHMGTTNATYGDTIANTANTVAANVNSQLIFGATANLTTPAGIYSTNETLIATGTF